MIATTPQHPAPAPATETAEEEEVEPAHPGVLWLDHMACAELETAGPDGDEEAGQSRALSLFFVEAGHVISEGTLNTCRGCPVRRECVVHAYKGGPGGTPIMGGYLGGFSLGQRRAMTLLQALARAKNDPPRPPQRKG